MSTEEIDVEAGAGPGISRTPPPELLNVVENDEIAPLSPEPRSPTKRRKTTSTIKGFDAVGGSPTSPPEGSTEKRASFFLPLFSRKHHHQSSSENLPSKATSTKEKEKEKEPTKPQKEKIGPGGDAPAAPLSFPYNLFSRFFSHSAKTATSPVSPPAALDEKGDDDMELEGVLVKSHELSADSAPNDEITSEFNRIEDEESTEGEYGDLPESEPPIQFSADRVLSGTADHRQTVQQSLLNSLEEFRSGNMRALNDESLEKLRDIHRQQLELHRLHVKLHQIQMLNPLESTEELDKEFDRLNDVLLNGLHSSMQNFTAAG